MPWEAVAYEHAATPTDRGLVKPPRWLPGNVQYETIMGSVAYGVSSDTSDVGVYGWAIPPKDDLFPHLRGEVLGFGTPKPRFEQYQEHHVQDQDALAGHGRTYDLTIYGIVKFFNLAMERDYNLGRLVVPRSPISPKFRVWLVLLFSKTMPRGCPSKCSGRTGKEVVLIPGMASVIVGIAKPPLNLPGHRVPSQKSVVNRQHVSLNLGAATARSGCSGVLRRGHFRRQLAPNLAKNS